MGGGNGSINLLFQLLLKSQAKEDTCLFSVRQVSFYDDDVRFWQLWRNRSAAAEPPSAVNQLTSAFNSPAPSSKGRHFLVICCENKAIFLDLVTMRGRDVPKQDLDNRSLIWQVIYKS